MLNVCHFELLDFKLCNLDSVNSKFNILDVDVWKLCVDVEVVC